MTSIYEITSRDGKKTKEQSRETTNRHSIRSNPLYLAAGWMADKRLSKTREGQTKDLVGSLLSHGARAWRMSQPTTNIHLRSMSPFGHPSIHIRVK